LKFDDFQINMSEHLSPFQVIIPHLTESYASSVDPPEKSIPICTLRHFPNDIHHTIQWARDRFEGIFTNDIMDASKFLADENYLENLPNTAATLESLRSIKKLLIEERPTDFFDCIKWARCHFEDLFSNQIKQLLFNFPSDLITANGQAFWSGNKKVPSFITFDVNQRLHIDFIVSCANLRAEIFDIEQNRNYMSVIEGVQKVVVPDFEPKSNVKIPVNDSELEEKNDEEEVDEAEIGQLIEELREQKKLPLKAKPLMFEKDDDSNLHMDFVVAASNLRATNYKIPPADKLKSKLIAGKIQPAIATSTSIVAGFASLEMYKIAQG
jgi:ubiquitin-activating enzyme E1